MKILLILLVALSAHAQYDHDSVFPDLEGNDLFNALRNTYKPQVVLELTEARDTLYKRVHLHNDSVRCVYTGLSKYLDPQLDPSQALFEGGGNSDLNLEHSYPQAKGAGDGNPRSDMHHLFPTRVPVNSARGNDPMMNLPDNQSTAWYYLDQTRSNAPSTNRELWSEDTNFGFEPRDDFKGNIARAYFYFYTMYKEEADFDDPEFFAAQQEALCEWHSMDPVDSLEWERTFKIAEYQDDKVNPFVLDCRLARFYCGEISPACTTVNTNDSTEKRKRLVPNLVSSGQQLIIDGLPDGTPVEVYDFYGKLWHNQSSYNLLAPTTKGIYIIRWSENGRWHTERLLVQ